MNKEEKKAIEILEYFEPDDLIECAMYRECIKKIYSLLGLYNKEKEKNKKLKELLQKKNRYTHELEKDLFEGCSNYVVRKDEIKEIIYPTPENPISIEIQSSKIYKRLKELLGE